METSTLASDIASSINTASETLKNLPLSGEVEKEVQRTELELFFSLEKIRKWQQNWSSQTQHPSVPAKLLWGVQGWGRIQTLLNDIAKSSTGLKSQLQGIQQNLDDRPDTSGQERATAVVGQRPGLELKLGKEIRDLAGRLNESVDQLWIYSEACFDSLHGVTTPDSELTGRDELLRAAVGSRLASLELYSLCIAQTEDCSIEINLRSSSALEPCYRLVAEPKEKELRRLTVTSIKVTEVPHDKLGAVVESSGADLPLFKPSLDPRIIKVPHHDPNSPHYYLQIAAGQPNISLFAKSPESLADILKGMRHSTYEPTQTYLDMEAKFELAFKVVESGLFLLGTPFFASLSSRSLRRLDDGTHRLPSFMLRIPSLDLQELVADEPGALAESAQLLRVGVVLMEIALGGLDHDVGLQDLRGDPDAVSKLIGKLAAVEKAMGTRYCKATAFCLQYDCGDRFSGPQKYDKERYGEWVIYLSGVLAEYYAQVYLG